MRIYVTRNENVPRHFFALARFLSTFFGGRGVVSKLTQSTPFFEEVGAIPPAPRVFAGSLKVPPCILWIITAGYLAVHALPGIHALFLDHFL